jgi:hypothetical protein
MKNGRRYPANARSRSCHAMAALNASWLVRSDSTAISCSSGVRPLLRLQFDLQRRRRRRRVARSKLFGQHVAEQIII